MERKLVTKFCAIGWLQLNEFSVPNSDFATLHHTDRQSQMISKVSIGVNIINANVELSNIIQQRR